MQRKRPRPVEDAASVEFTPVDPALVGSAPTAAPAPQPQPETGDWQQKVAGLVEEGLLTPIQAGEMDRFFAERQAMIGERLPLIEAEFLERRDRDGTEPAMDWLRGTKQQIQQDQRDATRRMLASMGLPEEALG